SGDETRRCPPHPPGMSESVLTTKQAEPVQDESPLGPMRGPLCRQATFDDQVRHPKCLYSGLDLKSRGIKNGEKHQSRDEEKRPEPHRPLHKRPHDARCKRKRFTESRTIMANGRVQRYPCLYRKPPM